MRVDLERLYDEYAQALFAFLLNLTHHEYDTRDLLQEIFFKIARRPELLHDIRDERAFLLRLAYNSAVDLVRRQLTRTKAAERLGQTELFASPSDPDQAALQEAVGLVLKDLPPEQRAVLHLKIWEGLTFESIAQTLSISPNTAASRYRYALDKLGASLASYLRRNEMNSEAVEKKLREMPLRSVPSEWRAEILVAAGETVEQVTLGPDSRFSLRWREWLWPCPQAWGVLTATWLLILGLNLSEEAQRKPDPALGAVTLSSAVQGLRERKHLLTNLLEEPRRDATNPPRFFWLRPRTTAQPSSTPA